jgi:hypothetical protein
MAKKNTIEVPQNIKTSCNAQIEILKNRLTKPGHLKYQSQAIKVMEKIRDGGTFEEIQELIKNSGDLLPATFNGAWFPRELHDHLGRITEETFVIRTSTAKAKVKTYEDLAVWETKNGEANEDDIFDGAWCKCLSCGALHVVKEAAHQFYCASCAASRPGRGSSKGIARTPGDKRMLAISRAIISKRINPEDGLAKLNAMRLDKGQSELTLEDLESLMSNM